MLIARSARAETNAVWTDDNMIAVGGFVEDERYMLLVVMYSLNECDMPEPAVVVVDLTLGAYKATEVNRMDSSLALKVLDKVPSPKRK